MNHPNDTPDDDFDPVACEAEMARRRLITIDPTKQEEGFDRFVHVDEVAAVAAERDAYRAALLRLAEVVASPGADDLIDMMTADDADNLADVVLARLTAAEDALRAIAVALGQPDQDLADLPASVEALRLQRDRWQAAAVEAVDPDSDSGFDEYCDLAFMIAGRQR